MRHESNQIHDLGTERLILLHLLRRDRDPRWSLAELEGELYDVEPEAIRSSIPALEAAGVVIGDSAIEASPCATHIDLLGLIAI